MDSQLPDLQHATITQLQDGLSQGLFTSLDLVKAYIARTYEVNPELNAVMSISPAAFKAARELDAERKAGRVRSVLHGIPVAFKDTINTRVEDGMDTTAGSFALQGAIIPGDATCVARLREAGAIVLCKANLSTFGNFRGVASGAWSPVGGQCFSPYYPRGHPCGSSSGSAVVVASGLATIAIGGETGGSIISPCSKCSLVGIRPTVGLLPGDGGVPITSARDTFGPMTRTVLEGASVLDILAGTPDQYTTNLPRRLDGVRLLVPTNLTDWTKEAYSQGQQGEVNKAYQILRDLGAEVIEADLAEDFVANDRARDAKLTCMKTEFAQEINGYLQSFKHVPSGVRSLKDLIRYIKDDSRESPRFYDTCTNFESALARPGLDSDEYREAKQLVDRSQGLIDAELEKHSAQAFVLLSATTDIWSNAGWPQVTVPLCFLGQDTAVISAKITDKNGTEIDDPYGLIRIHPNQGCGITFAGSGFREATLIKLAYAFEQATQVRSQGKTYGAATAKTQLRDIIAATA